MSPAIERGWVCNLSWGWRDILTLSGRETTTHQSVPAQLATRVTVLRRDSFCHALVISRTAFVRFYIPPLYFPFNFSYSFVFVPLSLSLSLLCGRFRQVEVNKIPVELLTGFAAPRRPESLQIQLEVYL